MSDGKTMRAGDYAGYLTPKKKTYSRLNQADNSGRPERKRQAKKKKKKRFRIKDWLKRFREDE